MRDAIISRRTETVTTVNDYVTIRCAQCTGTFERRMADYSKTFTCPYCFRRCHVDTAIRSVDALPPGVTPLSRRTAS